MPRNTAAHRALALASRIESSAVTGSSHSACVSCRRQSRPCIRSNLSIRCSNCVRFNRMCVPFVSQTGRNVHISAVHADIRRLRASLVALERFITFSVAVPRDSVPSSPVSSSPGDPRSSTPASTSALPEGSVDTMGDFTPASDRRFPFLLSVVDSRNSDYFSIGPSATDAGADYLSVVAPDVAPVTLSVVGSSVAASDIPSAFVDPSLLEFPDPVFLSYEPFPEPPAGMPDFSLFFDMS
jgi:hypothetical protein